MRILLDTNILMTYLSGREDTYAAECEQIVQMCSDEAIEGVIAFHSLSTIWYLTRKAPEDLRRGYIKQICVLFSIAGADNEAVLKAIENRDFRDFEDALQDCCAAEMDCDYIITVNIKDYTDHSIIPAITPDAFIALMSKKNE